MDTPITFKDFLRLVEAGVVQPVDPRVAQAITSTAKTIDGTPQGKQMSAGDLVNKAAKDALFTGKVQPGQAIQALKTPQVPGQQQQMMNKKMKKK